MTDRDPGFCARSGHGRLRRMFIVVRPLDRLERLDQRAPSFGLATAGMGLGLIAIAPRFKSLSPRTFSQDREPSQAGQLNYSDLRITASSAATVLLGLSAPPRTRAS